METNFAIAYSNVIITDPKSIMKTGKITLDIETKDININPDDNETKVKIINEFINVTNNSLDNIIQKYNIKEIDLLSIDIDGRDLSVWKTLSNLKPKFVIIEFNQFIPFDIEYEDTTNQFIGNSVLSIYKYAISKDYDLIGATTGNLIFIDKLFNNEIIKSITIA